MGASAAVVDEVESARSIAVTLLHLEQVDGNETQRRALMDAFDPRPVHANVSQRLNETLPHLAAEGMAMALSTLETWRWAQVTLGAAYDNGLDPERGNLTSAPHNTLAAFFSSELVHQILEQAPRHNTTPAHRATVEDIQPILDAMDRTIEATPDREAALEWWDPVKRATETFPQEAHRYAAWDHPGPAAFYALQSLIYTETSLIVSTGTPPTNEEILDALDTVNNATYPPSAVHGHLAWEAYYTGQGDPAHQLLTVATANLWPLIEATYGLLLHGEPVDWESHLGSFEQRLEDTWGTDL